MTHRSRALAGALTALALIVTACGGDDSSSASGSSPSASGGAATLPTSWPAGRAACPAEGLIGFSAPLPDPNFQLLFGVVQADAKKAGVDAAYTSADLDPGKQIADVQSLLQRGAKAVIAAPVDPNALQPVVTRARQQKVPIVVTDTAIGGPYATNLQTSAREAGANMADYLKQKVGDGGVVAILGPARSEAVRVRNEGFQQQAQKIGLTVLDAKTNEKITREDARALVDAWRLRFGDKVKAVWAFNDTSGLGAASALRDGFRPLVVSMNAQPDAVAAVKAGQLTATWDLQPFALAHGLWFAAEQARCGKQLPPTLRIGYTVIDKSSVDSWVPWEIQQSRQPTLTFEQQDGAPVLKLS